jgi:hypothetical protein
MAVKWFLASRRVDRNQFFSVTHWFAWDFLDVAILEAAGSATGIIGVQRESAFFRKHVR